MIKNLLGLVMMFSSMALAETRYDAKDLYKVCFVKQIKPFNYGNSYHYVFVSRTSTEAGPVDTCFGTYFQDGGSALRDFYRYALGNLASNSCNVYKYQYNDTEYFDETLDAEGSCVYNNSKGFGVNYYMNSQK